MRRMIETQSNRKPIGRDDKIFILVTDLAQALIYLHVVLIIVQSLPLQAAK